MALKLYGNIADRKLQGLGRIMGYIKIIIAASLFAAGTFSVAASDIIVDNVPGTRNGTSGGFSYIGKGSSKDHIGGGYYDIYSMEVSRVNGIMTVKINTKFVDINKNNGLYFGDLFMSTTGWNPMGNAVDGYKNDNAFNTGTQWDYVYDLNGARDQTGNTTDTRSAKLHELKDYDLGRSSDRNNFKFGTDRGNYEHLYRVRENDAYARTIGGGSVETSVSDNYLQFVFDVSGTGLATATQIAFHWTMSCANDIIEGEVNFAGKVPEPAALGLLLLGLTGVGVARRRKLKT